MFLQVPLTRLGAVSYGMILEITMRINADTGVKIPVTEVSSETGTMLPETNTNTMKLQ